MSTTAKKIRVTLMKSPFGTGKKHMATVRGLGLRRRHHTVELPDTPEIRGMINAVSYMLTCKEI
jgi:large subunit ribosomal protein L30